MLVPILLTEEELSYLKEIAIRELESIEFGNHEQQIFYHTFLGKVAKARKEIEERKAMNKVSSIPHLLCPKCGDYGCLVLEFEITRRGFLGMSQHGDVEKSNSHIANMVDNDDNVYSTIIDMFVQCQTCSTKFSYEGNGEMNGFPINIESLKEMINNETDLS